MIDIGGDIAVETADLEGDVSAEQASAQGNISQTSGNSAVWGRIFGDIDNQEDLMNKTYNENNFVEITNEEIEAMFR